MREDVSLRIISGGSRSLAEKKKMQAEKGEGAEAIKPPAKKSNGRKKGWTGARKAQAFARPDVEALMRKAPANQTACELDGKGGERKEKGRFRWSFPAKREFVAPKRETL